MIYILGGNGFVGSAYKRLFERIGLEHVIITRDNYSCFSGTSCDVLINANGNSSKVLASRDPLADFHANVTTTRQLLHDITCGFYIHLSSCDVYPDCSSPDKTKEDANIDTTALSPYGFHKYLSEQCAIALAPKWLVIRQGGFVGLGMRKNAIFDILYGDRLWLHPMSRLQFLNTDASAEIVWKIYSDSICNEIINVCGDGTVCLSRAIEWSGRAPMIEPGARVVHYEVDINKVKSYYPIPQTTETVNHFIGTAIDTL